MGIVDAGSSGDHAGPGPGVDRADAQIAAGADAVAVGWGGPAAAPGSDVTARTLALVGALAHRLTLPVVVRCHVEALTSVLSAGAAAVRVPAGSLDDVGLNSVAAAGASIIVGTTLAGDGSGPIEPIADRLRAAQAARIAPERVLVEVPAPAGSRPPSLPQRGKGGSDPFPGLQLVSGLGHAVAVVSPDIAHAGVDPAAVHAWQTLVIARGARVLLVEDVTSARRVADIAAQLLANRSIADEADIGDAS